MPGRIVGRNKESYIHYGKYEGRLGLTPQELAQCACHGDEQITGKCKGHEKADQRLYILVINHLSQTCHIAKQQAYEDRYQRISQKVDHGRASSPPTVLRAWCEPKWKLFAFPVRPWIRVDCEDQRA